MKDIFDRVFFFCFLIYSLIGCSSKELDINKRVVIEINRYRMTVEELKADLKNLSEEKIGDIERLIEKELLLQEAQRQGIDKEKNFIKTIESYWEQTLLKTLIERKSKEIAISTYVYNNEIEDYYKASGEEVPFSEVQQDIEGILKIRKEAAEFKKWIQGLKDNAHIKINEKVLEEVFK